MTDLTTHTHTQRHAGKRVRQVKSFQRAHDMMGRCVCVCVYVCVYQTLAHTDSSAVPVARETLSHWVVRMAGYRRLQTVS